MSRGPAHQSPSVDPACVLHLQKVALAFGRELPLAGPPLILRAQDGSACCSCGPAHSGKEAKPALRVPPHSPLPEACEASLVDEDEEEGIQKPLTSWVSQPSQHQWITGGPGHPWMSWEQELPNPELRQLTLLPQAPEMSLKA